MGNRDIADKVAQIQEKIALAAENSGRKSEDILLLPATKFVAPEIILGLPQSITLIGENRAGEVVDKYEALKSRFGFHFIGTLQTNKVKYIIDKVDMIHSVNSESLAREIQKQAAKHGRVMPCLVEINLVGEESKSGINIGSLNDLLSRLSQMENISVQGLMAMPPKNLLGDGLKSFFKRMFQLFVDIGAKNMDNISMKYLSMGMSGDYETAISEGANIVRIGTGIFGERNIII